MRYVAEKEKKGIESNTRKIITYLDNFILTPKIQNSL
jgi:hypothetical protein